MQSGQLNIFSYRNPHADNIQNIRLFACQEMSAYLVVVPPGGAITSHYHTNADEIFDVVEGEGEFVVDGRIVRGAPGKCILAPAGSEHSLHNTGDSAWTLRVTYHDRVRPRDIGKLIRRAVKARFGYGG